ncbi:putative F420-0 ABC transporter substrate-binding protein [Homoserinimonas sp. OAct 916]|uniref:putative F420-0 ABC transporter substrate-binding protein n=1 Tax=Homoserinimonas sp. OAct 916 TaxID=2211450 RepID=UPI000DBE260E|nr:putative F420-0 ABC transporter substrate-binding protein [Homoserinimonas sp. OAct 916]
MYFVPHRGIFVVAIAASALLVAGCSAAGAERAAVESPASAAPPVAAATTTYPVTIDNCGTEVTFTQAPTRVVTIKSSTTELLVALGLTDRIIGQAFPDGPMPTAVAGHSITPVEIPVISDKVPGQEAVLDLEPDLVFAGWESNFGPEGAGDRDALHSLGVLSYVAPSACKEPGYKPEKLSFDDVFADVSEAGAIFDVPDAATTLVADSRAVLDDIAPLPAPLTALWWSSGVDLPYVGAGTGAPQMIMEAAGLTNVAARVDDTWTQMSMEAIVDANPQVIVLVDSAWSTAAKKKELLAANPATAGLDAVKNERYIVAPFAETEAGVRNADLAAQIAVEAARFTP